MKKLFIILILLLSFNNIYSQIYSPTTCTISSKLDSTRHILLKLLYMQIGVKEIPDFYNLYDPLAKPYVVDIPKPEILITSDDIRKILLDTLDTQLGIRENPKGSNRGKMIDIYNNEVNAVLGSSWCGSFVGSNLNWSGVLTPPNPHTAWAASYARQKDIIWKAKEKNNITLKSGDVVTFYYSNLGRVGHTGFYIKTDIDGYFITIEGNTNSAGSRDGDGVYKKKRDSNKVYAVSRYIK